MTDDDLSKMATPRIVSKLPQVPMAHTIYAGQYSLCNYRPGKVGEPGKYWLTNGEGEGMETTEDRIEAMFHEFFNKEF